MTGDDVKKLSEDLDLSVIGFSQLIGVEPKTFHTLVGYRAAGINPPAEVSEFFDDEPPDDKGVITFLSSKPRCPGVTDFVTSYQAGFDVEISKLPKDIAILRFYNSW